MVTKFYPPVSYGGTEKVVEAISRKLAKKGLSITIAGPALHKQVSYEKEEGVFICRFPIHGPKNLEFSSQMRNFIKTSSYDIIHFHTFDTLCRFLRMGLKKPYAITTHGFIWKKPNIFNPIEYIFKSKVLKDNFQKANQIFCVSKKDYEYVVNMFGHQPNKLCYIPNGIDVQKFSNLDNHSLKKKCGMEHKIVITQVARFAPQKGQHILLHALKEMPKEARNKYVAFLAGYTFDTNYFHTLKNIIKEGNLEKRVFLLPNINEDQLRNLYGMTDIFVLPSFAEGLPLTLLEAWASKCAVIITAVGGVPYVINNGIDGFLIPPNDKLSLSEKMAHLVLNEEARMNISIKGYERVKNEFNLDNVIEALIKRYQKILESGQ